MADQEEKDQKTEEATPRRLEEARQQGQVALSTELIAAVGLTVGLMSLTFGGDRMMQAIGGTAITTIDLLGDLGTMELSVPVAAVLIEEALTSVLGALALVTLPAIVISLLVGYLQVGFKVTPRALELKWSKVNPVSGWSKFFSLRSVVRTGMSALKIGLITAVVVVIAYLHVEDLTRVGINELGPLLAAVGRILLRCCIGALSVILALSVVDLLYQRFQHAKDQRMSKKEVKEEARMTDGDPHVKARIRRMQTELSSRRMMAEVPNATVVVTNPTHFAVALRYERELEGSNAHRAPVCVAKGVDAVAQRIKAVAREAGVVCHEDVPLARALHAQCEIGQEIPEDLYAAVAAVLGYVYRLRGDVPAMTASA